LAFSEQPWIETGWSVILVAFRNCKYNRQSVVIGEALMKNILLSRYISPFVRRRILRKKYGRAPRRAHRP
jgi:hypothetical protein